MATSASLMRVGRERRRTLLWLALLVGSTAASLPLWFAADRPTAEHDDADAARPEFLLPVPLTDIVAVEIVTDGRSTRFERARDGAWLRHAHTHSEADAAHQHTADAASAERIGTALAMFGRTRIERTIGTLADRSAYGLTYPSLIAMLYAADRPRPLATLQVGDLAPNGLGRYAALIERGVIVVIPDYQVRTLKELVTSLRSEP